MTSAVFETEGVCSGCTDGCTACTDGCTADCTRLEDTTAGLFETGIGALPTGGASIAVAVVVILVSFSVFSDDSMTCFDEFLISDEELFFIVSSFSG